MQPYVEWSSSLRGKIGADLLSLASCAGSWCPIRCLGCSCWLVDGAAAALVVVVLLLAASGASSTALLCVALCCKVRR